MLNTISNVIDPYDVYFSRGNNVDLLVTYFKQGDNMYPIIVYRNKNNKGDIQNVADRVFNITT